MIRKFLAQFRLLRIGKMYLDRAFRRARRRIQFQGGVGDSGTEEDWKNELPTEVAFWDTYVESEEFLSRLKLNRPFSPEPSQDVLLDLIARSASAKLSHLRVLDVGAGPATNLGTVWPGGTIEIVPVDPLALDYEKTLTGKNLHPPIRTIFGEAEKLLDLFPESSFDLTYSSNALDHAYDPVTAIRNMTLLCKPGCFVFLRHFENEADREDYYGLHKWNFFERRGDMIVANRSVEISLRKALSALASVRCTSHLERHGVVHTEIYRNSV